MPKRVADDPWKMWGNTQRLTVPADSFINPNVNEKQITLCRAQYGRPETWRWLVSATMISGPATGAGDQANASCWFELLVGLGRANVRIPFWITFNLGDWSGGFAAPVGLVNWTSKAQHTLQTFSIEANSVPPRDWVTSDLTDIIVADHITVVAHGSFTTDLVAPAPIVVEVSCLLSPNTHVRPDWYQVDAEPSKQFPGDEIGGR